MATAWCMKLKLKVFMTIFVRNYEVKKTSLSCFDDKIYILDNGIDASALGA